MKKIALTTIAVLVATSAAFAGSDHYGSANVNQPVVTTPSRKIDNSFTGSILKIEQRDLHITPDANQPQSGQGVWGH